MLFRSHRAAPEARPQAQRDEAATHAPKIFTDTCCIQFDQPVQQVHDFVRGLSPHPGAWTELDGKTLKILRTALQVPASPPLQAPGSFLSDGKHWLLIACADGWLQVLDLQMEGKKRMSVRDFLNGYRL